ncbi:MAG: NADH-quinone oxidoreductase subunit N [Candidatus Micrarchaeota archaeon]|nr:NADH-quinone oxidoreductase subunit N [Candidatus Micrarchaeota archaeon]
MIIEQLAMLLVLLPFAVMILSSCVAIRSKSRRLALWGSLAGVLIAAFGATIVMDLGLSIPLLGYLTVTPLSAFFLFLASSGTALVEILAFRYSEQFQEFAFFMSLSFIGMFLIAAAQSLLPIIIGFELMTVSTAFMMLVHGRKRAEAAIKLFIFGSLAIAVFAFATALILQYNPSLSLSAIPQYLGYIAMVSLALFLVALGFETASFPFNLWIPDVYQGAPAFVTAALAGINKKIAFLALIEVLFFVFTAYFTSFYRIVEVLAIVTMLFGNILALKQKNLKRLFAYSSISQAGYILVGIAVGTHAGLTASLFYIFAHSFMIIGVFAIVGFLESHGINTVDDCNSLYSRNAFIAVSLTLIMLSMAGIPGLVGFFGKFILFTSAISAGMYWLAVIGVLNSFISIYYYARIVNASFQRKNERTILIDRYVQMVVVFALAIIITFGVFPQPLISMASAAASFIP